MAFSDRQSKALGRAVAKRNVRRREVEGRDLPYIEGWFAIAEANRIFGFDGWDRETLEAKVILTRELRGRHLAIYAARVRITVRTATHSIIREGHGTGQAQGASGADAHDRALKAAETDATKRALVTFGKAFGLALHLQPGASLPAPQDGATLPSAAAPKTVSEDEAALVASAPTSALAAAPTAPMSTPPAGATRPLAPPRPAAPTRLAAILDPLRTPRMRIDKSVLTWAEVRRLRDKQHLRHVATQPCLICSTTPSDAHHLRFAQARALGRKVSDEFTVPLCRRHHQQLHRSGNEAAWWHDIGIEPLEIAAQLWRETELERGATDTPVGNGADHASDQ